MDAPIQAGGVVCVFVEHADGKVHGTSQMLLLHAAALAAAKPHRIHAVMAAGIATDELAVLEALRRAGVHEATLLEAPPCDSGVPCDALAAYLHDLRPALVLMPATPAPTSLTAQLAAAQGCAVVPDCVAVSVASGGGLVFTVSTAGGMALVDVEAHAPMVIALMPQREFEAPAPVLTDELMRVTRMSCAPATDTLMLEPVSTAKIAPEDISLAEASVIVSGGRGLGKSEVFDLLRELASLLGGHVGASRVATDLGWIDREHLVGMSGSTVRPSLYFAIGISGAPHHLMGMREAGTILALNLDPSAPIFQLATHAFVGDMHEVVPRLIERLGALRTAA